MTKKIECPTTFVFPDGEKPVISSKAFADVYSGDAHNRHGNLMVKIRAASFAMDPAFVGSNVHVVISAGPTGKQREVLMTEAGARAILDAIRLRAPKAMSDFVERAIPIVDARFASAPSNDDAPEAPAAVPSPAPGASLDEALARNVALSARGAEMESELDDLREQVSQQEDWLEEAEAEKAALRQRIAELEGATAAAEPDKVAMVRALSSLFIDRHVPEAPATVLAASLVLDNNYGPEMIRELRPYL